MSITSIKEIDLAQTAGFKAIPSARSKRDKYIAKDFVLDLGGVKIKLKASDSLRDVVRKINLQSHVTGVRGKAVKGKLTLELIRNKIGSGRMIRLSENSLGGGMPLNANQIIADFLKSLASQVVQEPILSENAVAVEAWEDLMHLCSINEEAPPAPLEQEDQLAQIDEADEILEDDDAYNLYLLNELPQLALDEESEHSDSDSDGVGSNSHDHQSIHDSDHEEIDNNPIENQIINVPQGFMQQIVLNLLPNVSPVNLDNYDQYIEKLTQKKRSKLEVTINKRLHVFKQSYPSNICISKDSLLKDKLVFCLKEVKKNRMKAIPRTNHL